MIYQEIAKAYNELFPVQKGFAEFICHRANPEKVLDLGCGPGLYLDQLRTKGHRVDGIELSSSLKEQAPPSVQSHIFLGDLAKPDQWLSKIPADFSLIYCIGNTLSYLNPQALEAITDTVYDLLQPGGKFVVQVVNWDKILSHDGYFEFPEKSIPQGVFRRHYTWEKPAETVAFELSLTSNQGTLKETHRLYPKCRETLLKSNEKAGFAHVDLMGNWDAQSWSVKSGSLIAVSTKL